jgi:hypothetical protein
VVLRTEREWGCCCGMAIINVIVIIIIINNINIINININNINCNITSIFMPSSVL